MEQEKNEKNQISQSLENIRQALIQLSTKIDEQDSRINKLESLSARKGEINQSFVKKESSFPLPSTLIQDNVPATPPKTAFVQNIIKEKVNLEENIGVTWFARIGIFALVLGVSFFLKYAFDNEWIGETGRVIIGIVIGIVLLGLGEKYIRKYQVYGQIISGGGIAVLYLSIFSAYSFYELITQYSAFFMMMLITAVGIILSLRYNAISLIIVAIVGGFATPFLISSGKDEMVALFFYILLLDLAVLVVSIFKKWRALNLIGFFGTILVFSSWMFEYYETEKLGSVMFFLTLFFVVYSISSLIYNLVKKENSTGIEQILTILSATIYFAMGYALMDGDYHVMMGFFALFLAIYYFLWAYLTKMLTPEDGNLYNFLALLTIGFITIAIPIQFKGNVITLFWAVEAVVLFMLGNKVQKENVKALGLVIFGLTLFRLLTIDSEYSRVTELVVLNKIFFTFLFVIITSYLLAYISKKSSQENEENDKFLKMKQLFAVFIIIANFLTIFAVSREITFYWENKINNLSKIERNRKAEIKRISPNSGYYNNNIHSNDDYYNQMEKMKNKGSLSLSIFWLIYGIILMVVGIAGKYKGVRIGGMALLILAILKLFFYDLWELGTLYRIIASISLGVALLGISFAYQKYKDKLREII